MITTMGLVKENHIKKIDNSIEVVEKIKDETGNLIKLWMKLIVTNKAENEIYQVFCEENAKNREMSRMNFFEVEKFPDGIFVKFNNDIVDLHICELKLTPSNKLKQLKEQLFSGYVHCKSLLAILDIPLDYKINYHFSVFYVNDKSNIAEYNRFNPKKVTPGEPVINESDYELWKQGKALYQNGDYKFSMDLNKYQMTRLEKTIEYQYIHDL